MEVYAHASDSADRDAAKRLQKRFQSAFRGDPRRDPNVTHGRENLGHDGSRTVNKGQTPNPPQGSDQEVRDHRISAGSRALSRVHPERDEGASGLRCDPKSKKHLRCSRP